MTFHQLVLDVGAGLGFAGLACAACTGPKTLQLTDGDPEVPADGYRCVVTYLSVDVRSKFGETSKEKRTSGSKEGCKHIVSHRGR